MRKVFKALTLLALFLSLPVAAGQGNDAVIEFAKAFLMRQGYTTAPAQLFQADMQLELWDGDLSVEELKEHRYGTVVLCAVDVMDYDDGWLVSFPLSERGKAQEPLRPRGTGRFVFVSDDLTSARLIHAWAPLPAEFECR